MSTWNRQNPKYRRPGRQRLPGLWRKLFGRLFSSSPAAKKKRELPKPPQPDQVPDRGQPPAPVPNSANEPASPNYTDLLGRLKGTDKSRFQNLESKIKSQSAAAARGDDGEADSASSLALGNLEEDLTSGIDLNDLEEDQSSLPEKKPPKSVRLKTLLKQVGRSACIGTTAEKPDDQVQPDSSESRLWTENRRYYLRPSLLAALLVLLTVFLVFGLPDSEPPELPLVRVEPPAAPLPPPPVTAPQLPPGPLAEERNWFRGLLNDVHVVEKGTTLSQVLEALSISQAQRKAIYLVLEREGILTSIKPGEEFRAMWSGSLRSEDTLERLEFRAKPGARPLVFLPGGPDGFVIFSLAAPAQQIHQATQGTITDTFWGAGEKAGLEPWVILHLVDLMASQVDFVSDIRSGDDFQLLFRGQYQEGSLIAKPVIEMICMTNGDHKYEFYRHVGDDGKEGYFDVQFRSIFKNFFKSPLQYSRISSSFSRARAHPILKIVRPHLGVDYAAPEGTPVSAVADGVVNSAGFRGDYGRLVVVDHEGGYRTMYAHLSRIAKGIAPGVKVSQGDLLGNVGMSGLATGPHLDFRLLHKGQFVDPQKFFQTQEGRPMPPEERMRFAQVVTSNQELMKQLLEGN